MLEKIAIIMILYLLYKGIKQKILSIFIKSGEL